MPADMRTAQRALDGRVPDRPCIGCQGEYPEVTFRFRKDRLGKSYPWETRCKSCRNEKIRTEPNARARDRGYYLKYTYNITLAQFDAIFESQGRKCAACFSPDPGGRDWHIDHDHACCPGKKSCGGCVRGILCHGCNTGLGNFGDDPLRLRMAANYLEGCHG